MIPPPDVRYGLRVGDFAKLIFRIAVDDEEYPEEVERMWVIVREVREDGYIGILDNEPVSVAQNEEFWRGIDLPFEARHVIDAREGNEESVGAAAAPSKRPWC